uniref:Ig-like domain-containing protein n=1 Tax=Seriola dumerili TaxID=41447 RepID=A0A3B4U3F4_SERDU
MESCILPCSFQGDTDVIIHWNQVTAGNSPVHSFYYNKDQLTQQDQRFSGRTSVFKDQIPGGNASLQLTGLQVQDQGRYKCYTGTNRGRNESFTNLTVDGEKHTEHHLSVFVLVSEGIYPEPELTWSTSPPSTVTFKSQAEVQETEQLLYNISSSLTVSDSDSDLSYSCSISTRRNKRRLDAPRRKMMSIILVWDWMWAVFSKSFFFPASLSIRPWSSWLLKIRTGPSGSVIIG